MANGGPEGACEGILDYPCPILRAGVRLAVRLATPSAVTPAGAGGRRTAALQSADQGLGGALRLDGRQEVQRPGHHGDRGGGAQDVTARLGVAGEPGRAVDVVERRAPRLAVALGDEDPQAGRLDPVDHLARALAHALEGREPGLGVRLAEAESDDELEGQAVADGALVLLGV